MRPFSAWALVAILATGCVGGKPQPESGALGIILDLQPSGPVLNLTDSELAQYPPVQQLFQVWDREWGENATNGGYDFPYPYEEGVKLVKALQERMPPEMRTSDQHIMIGHHGKVFLLYVDRYEVIG
jgi:hypothetical protein